MAHVWKFVVAVHGRFQRHQDSQAASAIAYQVLFAIVPLTGLLLAAFGFVMRDPQQRRNAVESVVEALPLQSNAFVTQSIHTIAAQSAALTALGLIGFLWSASGLFGAIRGALNTSWEVRAAHGFLRSKVADLGTMVTLGMLLAASTAGTVSIHFMQAVGGYAPNAIAFRALIPILTAAGIILPAAFSFLSFLILYRVVPNVDHGTRDVWVGAMLATLLFEAVKNGFALFVARFNRLPSAYGALGDIMLFMLWMWISASILLIGAEVSAEFCRTTNGPVTETRPPADEEATRTRAS